MAKNTEHLTGLWSQCLGRAGGMLGMPYTRKLESTGWLGTKWYKHAPITKMTSMPPDARHIS